MTAPTSGRRRSPSGPRDAKGKRRCLYCLEMRPASAFNREHVLQQAFGKFENNLVLDCVCLACNQAMGDTIDLRLARDTVEGVQRVRAGVTPASKLRGLGAKSAITVRYANGPLRGAYAFHTAGPNGGLAVEPVAQVGFAKDSAAEIEWFPIASIPSKDEMTARGYGKSTEISVQGVDMVEAAKALAVKGWTVKEISRIDTQGVPRDQVDDEVGRLRAQGFHVGEVVETPLLTGRVETSVTSVIGRPVFRALTKAALNYIASVMDARYALLPQFNDARRFARYDVDPQHELVVSVRKNPWQLLSATREPVDGHYIGFHVARGEAIVQIFLLTQLRYVLRLGIGLVFPAKPSAHLFDLRLKRVKPAPLLPLVAAPGFELQGR